MEKRWTVAGLILLIIAIVLGAFGAHALKDILHDAEKLQSFETGVRYQFFNGLAFLAMSSISQRFQLYTKTSFRLILTGVLLFSLSIYVLILAHISGMEVLRKIAGPITPIGGLFMIIGWTLVLVQVIRSKAQ
jgi:uncharacterized membrane protein YgdD (TMEM256/DUF423 family)